MFTGQGSSVNLDIKVGWWSGFQSDQGRNEKRVIIKEETFTSDGKIDSLTKSVERIMDRLENMEKNLNGKINNHPQ